MKKGCCSREKCPYSHVFCGKKAKVCIEFSRNGFCILGSKCDKTHIIECSEFMKNQKCSKGDQCPFSHNNVFEKNNNKTFVKLKVEEKNNIKILNRKSKKQEDQV
jgi:hypothetical protein